MNTPDENTPDMNPINPGQDAPVPPSEEAPASSDKTCPKGKPCPRGRSPRPRRSLRPKRRKTPATFTATGQQLEAQAAALAAEQ